MIILDTNVLSEVMRPIPSTRVLKWFASEPASGLFTTAITQAEILYGIELLPKGRRRAALESAVEAMFEEDFADRILPFDTIAARVFPNIAAKSRAAQIASIARVHRATVATRNTTDFSDCGVPVVNPWSE